MSTLVEPLDLTAHGELDRATAAAWLSELAASLSQPDGMDVEFDGITYPIATTAGVELQVELHVITDADGPSTRLTIEMSW